MSTHEFLQEAMGQRGIACKGEITGKTTPLVKLLQVSLPSNPLLGPYWRRMIRLHDSQW